MINIIIINFIKQALHLIHIVKICSWDFAIKQWNHLGFKEIEVNKSTFLEINHQNQGVVLKST